MAKVKTLIDDLTGQTEARDRAIKEVNEMVQQAKAKLDVMESKLRDMFRNKELEAQMEIVGDRMGRFQESTV